VLESTKAEANAIVASFIYSSFVLLPKGQVGVLSDDPTKFLFKRDGTRQSTKSDIWMRALSATTTRPRPIWRPAGTARFAKMVKTVGSALLTHHPVIKPVFARAGDQLTNRILV
jgi:hypothetical protein